MKRIGYTLLLLAMALSLNAWPVRIQSWNLDNDVKTLNEQHISISSVNRHSGVIMADVRNAFEEDQIRSCGLDAIALPDVVKEYATQLWEETKDSKDPMRSYYTLDEYYAFMQQTAAQYPSICQLVQFGTSGQGRPLYMMKISDNVTQEENEPELKYVGSIHGNEVVGYDMLLRLIQLLTTQYGANTRITNIVNSTEMWINPMFNPDGYYLVQRYNAAGLDLNRNFPMPTGNQHPDGNAWGVENIAMMDFSQAHDFDLSINFHGGELVINYPWDYTYTLAPDDLLIRQMALTYSRQNSPMYNSTDFPQGITNGAAWYVVTGSMQDWNYGYTDCIELTAEIGTNMWPPASQLDTYWAQNQESMLQYIEFAQRGVSGVVTNTSGTPLNATITVAGNAKVMHNDLPIGDYHRLLLPGTYQITAAATGYTSQTAQVVVPATGSVTHDFVLATAVLTQFRGQIRSAEGIGIANAKVEVNSTPVSISYTDAQGMFLVAGIYTGTYQMTITASGYAPLSTEAEVSTDAWNCIYVLQAPVFADDFENGPENWTLTGTWGITQLSGNNVLTDSPSGNYGNNQNRTARLTTVLNLSTVNNPGLAFRCKYALESGYDFIYVEVSTNGSNWTQLGSFTGTQADWSDQYYSLASYAGGNLYFRFRLSTDYSTNADGIYIDNFQITGNSSAVNIYGDVNNDSLISQADITAINDYAVGLDPLPDTDPRPWDAHRVMLADADNNGILDPFDCYLLIKELREPAYLIPILSGTAEPVQDPGISTQYNGSLAITFSNPTALKSLKFNTGTTNLLSVNHVGFVGNEPYDQAFCADTDSYGFAGYNSDTEYINAALEPNPNSFMLSYTLNGVPGSVYINTGSASDDPAVPELQTALPPAYPNPFQASTTIPYILGTKDHHARLGIYNLKGQLIRSLENTDKNPGEYRNTWDGKDGKGHAVAAGIYFIRLQTSTSTQVQKLVLVK